MANGKGKEWLVGTAKWGYTPTFEDEFAREVREQQTMVEYKKLAGEFVGKDNDAMYKDLFEQSQVALAKLVSSNEQVSRAGVGQGQSDPVGIAGRWEALRDENQRKYDELEHKLAVVRQARFIRPPEDPEKATFYSKVQQQQAIIDKASRESAEIGGTDVALTFENAKRFANQSNWTKATEWLDEAHRKAGLVILRKPYLTAKLANEPKINAAGKINVKVREGEELTYGKQVKDEWEAILKLPDQNKYDEATARLGALVARIDGEIAKALKGARAKNKTDLVELKSELDEAKGNPTKLREIAVKIFQNTSQAEGLGIDPGENARKPFTEDEDSVWTAANCEETFVAYDWFALKKCRKEKKIKLAGAELVFSDDDMWKLVQYRGKVVNEEIDKLRAAYPTLIANATGSEDIESDIDIAFATPRSGDDVKAAKEFNAAIKSRFHKPPGRVFDVNIYPRDYRALRGDSFKPNYSVDKNVDHGIDEPDKGSASMKLSKMDMDVATLLKQRRFLDEDAFNEMLQTLMDQAPDEETEARIRDQYEEGEDIYLLTSLEKVEKIRANVNLDAALTDPNLEKHRVKLKEQVASLDALQNQGGVDNLKKAQRLIPRILDMFEETYPAEAMDVTDALYLDKMGELRQDQEKIQSLKNETAPKNEHHPDKTCVEVGHEEAKHDAWRKEKLGAMEMKVKKDMFTNIIFANEAIMSQGALTHVVGALQAKTTKARQDALDDLTAAELMQSVNEQVADLFKEMKHYEGVVEESEESAGDEEKAAAKRRATGEGYVHASKYFFRLLDAAIGLAEKYPDEDTVKVPYEAIKNSGSMSLVQLKKQVDDVLLKLRKSAVIPPEVKGEVGALEMQEIFPQVTDIASFRKMVTDFAIELNKRIRSLEEFKESQKKDTESGEERKAEKAYFQAAGT